jgi:hypothetical protein
MLRDAGRIVARGAFAIALVVVAAPAAGAQVQAQFFAPFATSPLDNPGTAPMPNLPFPGTPVCTTTGLGNASGFSLDFTTSATQAQLATACGPTTAAMLVHSFAARFTGSIVAPSTGTFALTFSSDDGNVLTINGTTVYMNWAAQASGPGSINVALNAGPNPFVFDYWENSFGGAFATINLGALVSVPPGPAAVAPEPSTLALLAGGLVAVGMVRRRRRA